jgi:hypothetical protein
MDLLFCRIRWASIDIQQKNYAYNPAIVVLVRDLPASFSMKLWKGHGRALIRHHEHLPHEFVIGPLHRNGLSPNKARLYYCTRCKWSFLVSGTKVAVFAQDGSPSNGDESLVRFKTFEDGPCPVLEAFASASSFKPAPLEPLGRKAASKPRNLVALHASAGPGRPRPAWRLHGRVRQDLAHADLD